jgi:hypothetical protein
MRFCSVREKKGFIKSNLFEMRFRPNRLSEIINEIFIDGNCQFLYKTKFLTLRDTWMDFEKN